MGCGKKDSMTYRLYVSSLNTFDLHKSTAAVVAVVVATAAFNITDYY